jgi:hypothetical protein
MSLARRIFVERRAVLLPLLVFLAINIGLVLLAVVPLQRAVASAEEQKIESKRLLDMAKIDDRAAQQASGRKDQADVELRKFYSEILPHDFPSARDLVISWAKKTADDSRLRFNSGTFDQKDDKDSRLVRVFGKVILNGDYANIRRFLYALETAPEFVIVENVELSQSGLGEGTGVQPANTPSKGIDLELTFATYYLGGAR